jgi:hypothetical protein
MNYTITKVVKEAIAEVAEVMKKEATSFGLTETEIKIWNEATQLTLQLVKERLI